MWERLLTVLRQVRALRWEPTHSSDSNDFPSENVGEVKASLVVPGGSSVVERKVEALGVGGAIPSVRLW